MTLLISGVLLWTLAHLFPAVAVATRGSLAERLGNNAYRGIFSLTIVASILLMVFGWKAATPAAVYNAPLHNSLVVSILMLLSFILFVASGAPGNLRRFVRHPQMTAVILWSAAHLLSNGDSRSITLFAGLGIWAVLEILFINRRDGVWQKPASGRVLIDVASVIGGIIAFLAIAWFHGSLFGPQLIFLH